MQEQPAEHDLPLHHQVIKLPIARHTGIQIEVDQQIQHAAVARHIKGLTKITAVFVHRHQTNPVPGFSSVLVHSQLMIRILKVLDRNTGVLPNLRQQIHITARRIAGDQALHIPDLHLLKGHHQPIADLLNVQVQVLRMLLPEAVHQVVLPRVHDQHTSVQVVLAVQVEVLVDRAVVVVVLPLDLAVVAVVAHDQPEDVNINKIIKL